MTPQYEVSSITDPSSSDNEVVGEIMEYIRSKPKILKVLPTDLMYADLVMSNKAGPNGPASISCLKDLAGITQKAPHLLETIKRRIAKYAGMLNFDGYEIPSGEFLHSKLVLLSDKACKTRVIAIADWWTNVCLSPVHNAFMKGLQRLPTDVTYFQDKIKDFIEEMGSSLYSSDMTAFTDRFPIELEVEVIKAKYGEQEGCDWKQLISDREFFHSRGSVTYKVGNPMGLLSSWAVSTFTHHVVKHWCAHKLGIKDYKYLILGDDTLDTREDVYRLYTSTIESLGVSISHDKCTQSEHGYAEFAKRLFSPEGEITGLPVHLLTGLKSNPEQVLELVRICRNRGYEEKNLGPGMAALLSYGSVKNPKMVADILALPEIITGQPPLYVEGWVSDRARNLIDCDESRLEYTIKCARNFLFWSLVDKITISPQRHADISPVEIENNHPLIFALNEKIDAYLPADAFDDETWDEDEYYIYDKWMEGEYTHMVNIPSVDTYKYYNKGHRVTKCKFDVARLCLQIANGNCNIPLTNRTRYTNTELYDIALAAITPKKDSRIAVVTTFT
jgi:hypothetical protein